MSNDGITRINEAQLRQMVFESVNNILNEGFYEAKKKGSKAGNKKHKKKVSSTQKAKILDWLKDPRIDGAEIMRRLWHPTKKKEPSKRSLFYKKRDGKLNDNGVRYGFSDDDFVELDNIQSSMSDR